MAVSFLSPSRTVLMISDEFLAVYTTGSEVRLLDTVPWTSENFSAHVAGLLKKDAGGKPVLILNDMVEQHYRKERITRAGVNVMDRQAILKRKLNVAFPNYPVRAAFTLKEKIGKTSKQAAADIYIFAALPKSEQYEQTIAAARKSLVSVSGLCLLPVESSDMVKALSTKLTRKGAAKPVWSIFMGQHKNGSLRQIVTKNGELALTRMSPITDRDDEPDIWAADVYQEFKATMSYLSRFGYEAEDGLDVTVIANMGAGDVLTAKMQEECVLHVLTVGEAAQALGLSVGRQENGRYADVLHVAWSARKTKFILPMRAVELEQVARPRQAAMFAAGLFACSALFLGYLAFTAMSALMSNSSALEDNIKKKGQLQVEYNQEVDRLNAMGFDVQLVQSSIAVNEQFEKDRMPILKLAQDISKGLGTDMRVDSLIIQPYSNPLQEVIPSDTPSPLFEARLKMTYPATADIDKGNREVTDLSARLQQVMPGNTVRVTKALKDYQYTQNMVVEAGDVERKNIQQDFTAEISIYMNPPAAENAPVEGGAL